MVDINRGEALLPLGAGAQFPQDLQHVYSSIRMATDDGHEVGVDALWTPVPVVVETTSGGLLVAQELDGPKAVELATHELERFKLPDRDLMQWELEIRDAFRRSLGGVAIERVRDGFADVLIGLGGLVVLAGTEPGVRSAAHLYEELRQLG